MAGNELWSDAKEKRGRANPPKLEAIARSQSRNIHHYVVHGIGSTALLDRGLILPEKSNIYRRPARICSFNRSFTNFIRAPTLRTRAAIASTIP